MGCTDQGPYYKQESNMHPSTRHILQYFEFDHLPEHLQPVSRNFHDLAYVIAYDYKFGGPEVTACLRKLLEARDCAVRAALTTTKPYYEKEVGEPQREGSITRKLTDEEQRDFNNAQAELTRLRQERHMELEEQARRDPSGTDDPVEMTKEGPRNIGEITGELSKRDVTEPRPNDAAQTYRDLTEQAERVFHSDPKHLKDIDPNQYPPPQV